MSDKKQELISQLLDKRAKKSNTTDLNSYANGLEAMYDTLNNHSVLHSIIDSAVVKSEIETALDSCEDWDICWDGENETMVDVFNKDQAVSKMLEIFKKHYL